MNPTQKPTTGEIVAAILITVFTAGYLLPTTISMCRKTKNMGNIALINILLGWTIIGWVWALIGAFIDTPQIDSIPPGWYENRIGSGYRWWDGNQWTEYTAN